MKRRSSARQVKPRAARYEDIARDFERENEPFPLRASRYDLAHLRRFFGGRRADDIDSSSIVAYALRRQERQRAPVSTINHELRTLIGVLRLASRNGKLRQFPTIEFLQGGGAPDQIQAGVIPPR